jgi:hypothetical protein
MTKELFEGATIEVEHGYLCVRNVSGWLLYQHKLGRTPIDFYELVSDATRHQEAWLKAGEAV